MSQDNVRETPQMFQFQIELASKGEEPVQIESGSWKGVSHIGIRQLFRGPDGRLYFGRQGFNIPVDDFERTVVALIECYNGATGATLTLHSAEDSDEDRLQSLSEEMVDTLTHGTLEQVYAWKRG